MKYKKILILFTLIFLFLIPISYAETNSTDKLLLNEENNQISSEYSNEIYFNSSSQNNGDGSIDNPYNSLTSMQINSYSVLHFADGNYEINTNKNLFHVKIIGQSKENTIINLKNHVLTTYNFVGENVTLKNGHIQNHDDLNLTNVIFENGEADKYDSYGNSYGGAILNIDDGTTKPTVNIKNSTLKENNADYGGAIYSFAGIVNIEDSIFFHNVAKDYGGAIACEYYVNLTIKNTVFEHCMATKNAGGAIYIRESNAKISNSTFKFNQGSFGGAICDLDSAVEIFNSQFDNNIANYSGGAVYKMYGNIKINYSNFINNNAKNGGAILVDNSTVVLTNNEFDNNIGETGKDVYCIMNIKETFADNILNDIYNLTKLNTNVESGNYTTFKYNPHIIETIPEYYSLVDEGYCTPVKHQQNSGNCWAFTQLAVLESCILKSTGEVLDLSEENMKNLIALFSDYGWKVMTNEGGLDEMGLGYLTSWLGPVLEEDDEFDDGSVLSPVLNSIMHVQNVVFLKRNNALDNNAIKEAILNYGGVGTGIYYDSEYLKYATSGYYYGGKEIANHAVTIVGWNDTYSKDNFPQKPAGDGAWIVKNSWGKNWGDNGYFYVSYYDTKLAEVGKDFISYTFILDDEDVFDKNYQYDIMGMTDFFNTGKTTIWYQNIFKSEGYETLKAFSTYFNTTTDYEAYIYLNNELKSVQVGTSQGGYHTIKLTPYINLSPNDEFKISIKIKAPRSAGFPVSEGFITNKNTQSPNISFFSYDGKTWYDLYNYTYSYATHTYAGQVACIKAFTSYSNLNFTIDNVAGKTNEKINVTASIYGENGEIINDGNITFEINNKIYNVNVTNSTAILEIIFEDDGIYDIQGFYTINKITQTAIANITKLYLEFNIDDYTYQKNININVISNICGNATITINNKTHIIILNNNDKITINETLLPGNYTAILKYNNITKQKTFQIYKIKTYIESQNQTITHIDQIKINASLKDENGNTLNNTLKTINNTIKPGNNTITIIFEGNEIYLPLNTTINIEYKKFVDFKIKYNDKIIINITSNIQDNATFNLNNKTYHIQINNNDLTTIDETLLPGNYTTTLKWDSIEITKLLIINKTKTQIKADNIEMYYKDGNRVKITLLDENNNILPNKTVIFNINGKNYTKTTNSNGTSSMNMNLNSAEYILQVTYKGDENYEESFKNITVKIKSTIIAEDLTKFYRNGSQFLVKLLDKNGNPLINQNTTFNINGVFYERKTNSLGIARLNIHLESGEYIITSINNLNGDKISNKVTVLSLIQENYDLEKYYRNASQYTVKVYNKDGSTASGVNVTFNINGVFYKRTTNTLGIAKLNINLNPDEYIITAEYNGCKASNNIKVKNILYGDDLEMKYLDGSQFKMKLVDGIGNPLPKQKITFNINGVFYTRETNLEGIAKLNIKLQSGEYIITSNFNNLNKSNKITIHG